MSLPLQSTRELYYYPILLPLSAFNSSLLSLDEGDLINALYSSKRKIGTAVAEALWNNQTLSDSMATGLVWKL